MNTGGTPVVRPMPRDFVCEMHVLKRSRYDRTMSAAAPALEHSNAPTPKGPFGLLFLVVLVDMLGFGIIIPLLPFYARHFEASNVQVALLLTVYSGCQFIAAPLLGALSDRVGRRPVLIYSQFGSAAASITLAVASAITFSNPAIGLAIVYVSRLVDGFSGGNVSAAQAYVADITDPKDRARRMGLLGAAFGIGFAIGPGIGGVLGHFHAWLPPLAAACFSLAAGTLVVLRLPESLTQPVKKHGWQLLRSAKLMRKPVLAQLNCVWFLAMFAFVITESIFALYLADRYHFTELWVGFTFMLAGIVIIIVQGRLIGPLTRKLGEWNVAIIGPLLCAAAMLIYIQTDNTPLIVLLIPAVVIFATGRSMLTPAISTLVSHEAHGDEQGAAFGLFHGMGSLSRVAGPAIGGFVYDHSMKGPFITAGAITAISGVWMLWVRREARARHDQAEPITGFEVVAGENQASVKTP